MKNRVETYRFMRFDQQILAYSNTRNINLEALNTK